MHRVWLLTALRHKAGQRVSVMTLCDLLCVMQDWKVPQAWFLHFYVLGCCCNAVVTLGYCLTLGSTALTPAEVGFNRRYYLGGDCWQCLPPYGRATSAVPCHTCSPLHDDLSPSLCWWGVMLPLAADIVRMLAGPQRKPCKWFVAVELCCLGAGSAPAAAESVPSASCASCAGDQPADAL